MVALATAATIIASQATISGAYSMTQQAIQLGYLPRMTIQPHVGANDRADLRSGGQLDLLVVVAAAVVGIRHFVAARVGVWRRGDGHDARHDVPHFLRRALRLALSAVALRVARRAFSC